MTGDACEEGAASPIFDGRHMWLALFPGALHERPLLFAALLARGESATLTRMTGILFFLACTGWKDSPLSEWPMTAASSRTSSSTVGQVGAASRAVGLSCVDSLQRSAMICQSASWDSCTRREPWLVRQKSVVVCVTGDRSTCTEAGSTGAFHSSHFSLRCQSAL